MTSNPGDRQVPINRIKEMEQAASIAVSIELNLQSNAKSKSENVHRIKPDSKWVVMGRYSTTNRWFM